MGHYWRTATLKYLWVMESEATEWSMVQEKNSLYSIWNFEIISTFKKKHK